MFISLSGELSSISGSDSEECADDLYASGMDRTPYSEGFEPEESSSCSDLFKMHHYKIFFESKDNLLLSVYRNAAGMDRKVRFKKFNFILVMMLCCFLLCL